jgi:hypothetical protein
MAGEKLWAITSYFNPIGYRRKLQNYRTFREHLQVPLIAVELSYSGRFELTQDDAEILVQRRGSAVLWQKERLLNVALSHVPSDCRYVAWLDCDIVFDRDDWAERTVDLLERYPLCQLYNTVYHIARDAPIEKTFAIASHVSVARALADGIVPQPRSASEREYKRGHAWAADRSLLERTGLYDRSIVGAGDKFIAFAAIGQAKAVVTMAPCSPAHAGDYLTWAESFRKEVDGRLGCLNTDVFHLWHGDLRDRGYGVRHSILADHGYDPQTDIALDAEGCWRWNSAKYEMHERVRQYFQMRAEDGPLAQPVEQGL